MDGFPPLDFIHRFLCEDAGERRRESFFTESPFADAGEERDFLDNQQHFFLPLLFASLPAGAVVSCGSLRTPLYVSKSLGTLLGEPPDLFQERLGNSWYNLICEEDRQRVHDAFVQQTVGNPTGLYELEYRVRRNDGSLLWLLEKGRHARSEQGKALSLALLLESSERRERMDELERRTQIDPLTGLYNRAYSIEYISTWLERHGADHASALLIFDLDNFKYINDSRGHLEGDMVLRKVGAFLKSQFHSQDFVGRIGGDEFIAFLQPMPSEAVALERAQKIQGLFEQTLGDASSDYRLTISVGVGYAAGRRIPFAELFRMADTDMYRNKHESNELRQSRIAFSSSRGMIEVRGVRTPNPERRAQLFSEIVAEIPFGAAAQLYVVHGTKETYTSLYSRSMTLFPDLPREGPAVRFSSRLQQLLSPADFAAYQALLRRKPPGQCFLPDWEKRCAEVRCCLADGKESWLSVTLLSSWSEAGAVLLYVLFVKIDERNTAHCGVSEA